MPSGQFGFRFAVPYRAAGLALGIMPATTSVLLEYGELKIRFGPWRLRCALSNVAGAQITGPYGYLKTIGPPHLSFADRGVTFATNRDEGVCISFHSPVPALDPLGWLRHPGATVTVEDLEGLLAALAAS